MVELVAKNLSLTAGDRLLVEKLDLAICPGQCWFVYGCNGAGKTTLLETLAGLRQPSAGNVLMDGIPIDAMAPVELARMRAYLPQGVTDAFGFTVLDMVLAAGFPWHSDRMWETGEETQKAFDALARMDVSHLAMRDIRSLSGGERQRVAIAALLAQDTPLLLLDEPAAALDLPHQTALLNMLSAVCREENRATLSIVHDVNFAWNVATHVLLLHGDGNWDAGSCGEMMQPEMLSRCLKYPIRRIASDERPYFVSF